MRPLRTALLVTAAVGATLGGVCLLLPPSLGDVALPPLVGDSTFAAPAVASGDPSLAEDVVMANVFSSRRTPPTTRYTPPDAAMDSSGGMLADTALPGDTPAEASGEPVLLGTVVGVRGTQALLQLDPLAGPARLYAVGDRDGGFRVVSIAPGTVVLAGPRGRVTLRLDPQEKRP